MKIKKINNSSLAAEQSNCILFWRLDDNSWLCNAKKNFYFSPPVLFQLKKRKKKKVLISP